MFLKQFLLHHQSTEIRLVFFIITVRLTSMDMRCHQTIAIIVDEMKTTVLLQQQAAGSTAHNLAAMSLQ